jgi:hypothetical protein
MIRNENNGVDPNRFGYSPGANQMTVVNRVECPAQADF